MTGKLGYRVGELMEMDEVWAGDLPVEPPTPRICASCGHRLADGNPDAICRVCQTKDYNDGLIGRERAAVDLCAAGFGAPHIRQRLFFVADADENRFAPPSGKRVCDGEYNAEPCGDDGELEYAVIARLEGYAGDDGSCGGRAEATRPASSPRISGRMDDASGIRRRTCGHDDGENVGVIADATDEHGNSDQGYWRGCDWILCRDGKWRPVEAGTFPLAHGTPARVGCLRGYGNAINPWAAKAFIESYCAARKEQI